MKLGDQCCMCRKGAVVRIQTWIWRRGERLRSQSYQYCPGHTPHPDHVHPADTVESIK